jgi:hypothetical protein
MLRKKSRKRKKSRERKMVTIKRKEMLSYLLSSQL